MSQHRLPGLPGYSRGYLRNQQNRRYKRAAVEEVPVYPIPSKRVVAVRRKEPAYPYAGVDNYDLMFGACSLCL